MRRIALALALLAAVAVGGAAAAKAAPDDPVSSPVARVDHCTYPEDSRFTPAWLKNEAAAFKVAERARAWLRKHPAAKLVAAGDWLSVSEQHGAYHVAFARDAGRHERELRKALGDPARLCVDPALYTLKELYGLQRRVDRDLAALRAEGVLINATGVDVPTDTLVIGLDRRSAGDATAKLRQRYGAAAAVRVEFQEEAVALSGGREQPQPRPAGADPAG